MAAPGAVRCFHSVCSHWSLTSVINTAYHCRPQPNYWRFRCFATQATKTATCIREFTAVESNDHRGLDSAKLQSHTKTSDSRLLDQQKRLKLMLRLRYVTNQISDRDYEELVEAYIDKLPANLEFVLTTLSNVYNDIPEAVRWLRRFSEERQPPIFVSEQISKLLLTADAALKSTKPAQVQLAQSDDHYEAPFNVLQNTTIIDDKTGLVSFLAEIISQSQQKTKTDGEELLLGVDCETRIEPGAYISSQHRIATIQFALRDRAYILDVQALERCLDAQDWKTFLIGVFGNPKIRKLGFHFIMDIHALALTLFDLNFKVPPVKNCVCIQKLCTDLSGTNTLDTAEGKRLSLEEACQNILHKSLNKRFRVHNWSRRPLDDYLIKYAVNDAVCLLSMYDTLQKNADSASFENYVKRSLVRLDGLLISVPYAAVEAYASRQGLENRRINQKGISFAMLSGKMVAVEKLLRRCGILCSIFDPDDAKSVVKLFEFAAQKNGVFLDLKSSVRSTERFLKIPVAGPFPSGGLVLMPPNLAERDALMWILRHFNISILRRHVFTYCHLCRGPILEIPSSIMKLILAKSHDVHIDDSQIPHESLSSEQWPEGAISITESTLSGGRLALSDVEVKLPDCTPRMEKQLKGDRPFDACRECGTLSWRSGHDINFFFSTIRTDLQRRNSEFLPDFENHFPDD